MDERTGDRVCLDVTDLAREAGAKVLILRAEVPGKGPVPLRAKGVRGARLERLER